MIDVMDMYRAEFFSGNDVAAKTHVQAFSALVDVAEPQSGLVRTRDIWNACEVMSAIRKKTSKPTSATFPVARRGTSTRSIREGHMEDAVALGAGFEELQDMFTLEMVSMIRDITAWAEQVASEGPFVRGKRLVLDTWADELLSALCWLPPPPPTVLLSKHLIHVSSQGVKLPCVRHALLLWLLYAMDHPAATDAARLIVPWLKNTLGLVLSDIDISQNVSTQAQRELFIWVSSVGVYASELVGIEQDWFMTQCLALCQISMISSLAQLKGLTRRFLFLERLQISSVDRIASKLRIMSN